MVDLLDKAIMEVIDNRKRSLKYNITDKVLGQHLARLQEEGYLESEKGRWRLTFKGKTLLEEVPTVVEAPKIEEAITASPPLTSPELAKSLEDLGTKRRHAIEFSLPVFTGVMFLATGLLLLADINKLSSIIILGLNAWVLILTVGVILFLIIGISRARGG
jgi:hypothetical protein